MRETTSKLGVSRACVSADRSNFFGTAVLVGAIPVLVFLGSVALLIGVIGSATDQFMVHR